MAVFVSFITNFNYLINIYTQILTFINGVFSHRQKYSNTGVVSRNILILLLFPKKIELILSVGTLNNILYDCYL